jgi:hypothetical protein
MWKLVIPTVLVALAGCGAGSDDVVDGQDAINQSATGYSKAGDAVRAAGSTPTAIGKYKNEIGSSQVFNSAVADLNGDGLDDVVLSGWASAQSTHVANRSGFVNLKIFIQQDNGSLVDKTDDLIGVASSTIWGSQRILINDFDNDSRPDIAVLGFQDGQSAAPSPSSIFWNNGNTFSRSDLSERLWAHSACAGDLNGDGLTELVTGAADNYRNTIYTNQGARQFLNNRDLTQEAISSAGTCVVLKDDSNGNVAVVTTNVAAYPYFSAVAKVWDKDFKFLKTSELPGSEEPGTNIELSHDINNVIPIDINNDNKIDLIITDNGNHRLNHDIGSMLILINQGDFVFKNETDKYLPTQSKTGLFGLYYTQLTINGHRSIYLEQGGKSSLWQLKNGTLVKHKEELLNSLTSGYQYTNIYKTKNGHSLFLINVSEYPYAKFYYRSIPTL